MNTNNITVYLVTSDTHVWHYSQKRTAERLAKKLKGQVIEVKFEQKDIVKILNSMLP